MRGNKIEVSGDLVIQQAKLTAVKQQLGDFVASSGYLYCFKNRHGKKFKKIHGQAGSVEQSTVDEWFDKLKNLISPTRNKIFTIGMKQHRREFYVSTSEAPDKN